MDVEHAEVSLIGHREENQDRCGVAINDTALLLVVIDGMGGHSDGAKAAEVALSTILGEFRAVSHPVFDPLGFLHVAIGRAHDELVKLGDGLNMESRPRATCVVCLVQDGDAFWAHVGDSRLYLVRNASIHERTRDHSHVELLLREGLITEEDVHAHPMRNYVECCLGGDEALPEMSIGRRKVLQPNDLVLACSDGLWSGVEDDGIATLAEVGEGGLHDALEHLAQQAVDANAPYSDNTTVIALRWNG